MRYEKNIGKFRYSNQEGSGFFNVEPADGVLNVNDTWEVKDFDTDQEAVDYGESKGLAFINNEI